MAEVYLECKLAQNYFPENLPGGCAQLLIKTRSDSVIQSRNLPLNIGIVIDVSASMKGDKIKFAREAASRLIDSLTANDSFSVTIFSDNARAIIPQTAAAEKEAAQKAIDRIGPVSGTRMYLGMEKGLAELKKICGPNSINLMMLLTDGETDHENRCIDVATQIADNKIIVSTFGLGETYNEDLLKTIADMTLGQVCHVTDPEELVQQFETGVGSVRSAAITDGNLHIALSEGVSIAEIHRIFPSSARLGTSGESGGNTCTINVGNMVPTELPVYGIKLNVPPGTRGSSTIADITMSYDLPGLGVQGQTPHYGIMIEYSDDKNLCSITDGEVMGYFNQLNIEGLVSQAVAETKRGNIAQATMIMSQAKMLTQKLGNIQLTQSISKASAQLTDKGNLTPGIMKTIKIGATHTVKMTDFNKKPAPEHGSEQGKDQAEQAADRVRFIPGAMQTIKMGVPHTVKLTDVDKKPAPEHGSEQGKDQAEQAADRVRFIPGAMQTIKMGVPHTVKLTDVDKKPAPEHGSEQGKDQSEQAADRVRFIPGAMQTIKMGVPHTVKLTDVDKKAIPDSSSEQGRDQMEIGKCRKCGARNKQGVLKCLYCGAELNVNVKPGPASNPFTPGDNPTIVANNRQQNIPSVESPTVKSGFNAPPIMNPPEVAKKIEQQIPPSNLSPTVVVQPAHAKKPMQPVEPIVSDSNSTKQPLAKLVIRQGVRRNHVFAIIPGIMTIGRWDPEDAAFPEIDLTEDDHDLFVSRKHAQITFKDGDYYIEDLGSANCTYINKKIKLTPGNTHKLQNGDEIIIGKITLGFLNDG